MLRRKERIVDGKDQRLADHHASLARQARDYAEQYRLEGKTHDFEMWTAEAEVREADAKKYQP